MASSSSSSHHHLLFFLLLITTLLLSIETTDARPGVPFHPCKTFIISSFTLSSFKPPFQNPQADSQNPLIPSRFFAIVREINNNNNNNNDFNPQQFNEFHPQQSMELFINRRLRFPPEDSRDFQLQFPRSIPADPSQKPQLPFPPFGVSNSLRERTKDILSVVVALLFGVGCGALTSATMYLVWSIVTNRYEAARDMEDDGFYGNDDSPKKMGYTVIPSIVAAADDDSKVPVSEAKEAA